MSVLLRPRSTTVNVGAAAYAAGDEISNSATAGSVVRPTFSLEGFSQGLVYSAQLDLVAASGNVVTTASDFELLIFHTADVPAAVGDNVTMPISAATRALAIAGFRFDDEGWTGPLGTVAAGTSQIQAVGAHLVQPLETSVLQSPWGAGMPFTFAGKALTTAGRQFTAVLRTLAAWNTATVVHTFGVTLDIEAT
ncbi:MAG: hypothetical protein IT185_02340 [Acidobacteria bacterium]|nr:hypothetical protein [Acidobacteriota bacterium]